MKTISCVYIRQHDSGRDEQIALSAEVLQDSGADCSSELCVVWTDEALEIIAAADLDYEELIGAGEAIEEAFWLTEREACRVSKVRQQTGSVAA